MKEVEGRTVQRPDAVIARDVDVVVGQGGPDLGESGFGHRDLNVLVPAGLLAAEQVDGPAADDPPRRGHLPESIGDLARMPGVPGGISDLDAAGRQLAHGVRRMGTCGMPSSRNSSPSRTNPNRSYHACR